MLKEIKFQNRWHFTSTTIHSSGDRFEIISRLQRKGIIDSLKVILKSQSSRQWCLNELSSRNLHQQWKYNAGWIQNFRLKYRCAHYYPTLQKNMGTLQHIVWVVPSCVLWLVTVTCVRSLWLVLLASSCFLLQWYFRSDAWWEIELRQWKW